MSVVMRALLDVRAVASGEKQVANDDTEALAWIVARIDVALSELRPTSRGMVDGKQVCAPHPSAEPYRGE